MKLFLTQQTEIGQHSNILAKTGGEFRISNPNIVIKSIIFLERVFRPHSM